MTVDKSPYFTLLCLVLFSCATPFQTTAQGPVGAYRELLTSSDMSVSDTIEGVDLQVITIEPSAHHGNVDIQLIAAGSGNTPNRFRVRYTPNPGFEGLDTFSLELNQFFSFPYLHYRAYRVAVQPSDIKLQEDFATTYVGLPVPVNVLGNDQSSGGPLTLTRIAVVNHGTASITAQNQILFTPQSGFSGVAKVSYVACDAEGHCKTGQLNIGVRPTSQSGNSSLPVATTKNTSIQIPLVYSGYWVWQSPAHGSIQMISGRAFRYTPDAGYSGADPFILRRSVNGVAYTLNVQMQVLAAPEPNKMAVNDYIYTPAGTPVSFNVRQNDLGNLPVTEWGAPNAGGVLSNTTSDGYATFTPDPDFNGAAVFQYALGNAIAGNLEMATVNVVVSNLSPAYDTFQLSTPKSKPFVVDYPVPYEIIHFEISQPPAHGFCQFYPGMSTQTIGGQSVTGRNLLVYFPQPNYTGDDLFEINYCLAANGECKSTVIRMDVADIDPGVADYCNLDGVWPGDADADGIVNNKDLLTLGFCMGQEGAPRGNASTDWYSQPAANWNNPFIPIKTDLKHADTDGNGYITQADAAVILQHYGRSDQLMPASPLTKKGLPFSFNLLTPDAQIGDRVEVEVSLGSAQEPVLNLYGLTFDAVLSSNIVDSAFRMEFYNNSWINLNAPSLTLDASPVPGRLETAFTRTNGQPVSGYGVIGKFSFIIIDIVDVGRPEDFFAFHLTMSNSSVQWGDGVLTNGSDYELEVPLSSNRSIQPEQATQRLSAYPSPANHSVRIQLDAGETMQSLALYELSGRLVQQQTGLENNYIDLNVSNLPNGLYLVQAQTPQGMRVRKIQVLHR